MDVRHPPFLLSLVLTTASLGALLTGCSYAPAKTESAPVRPGYQAPQPVAATAPATTQGTNTGASTAATTGQSAAAAQQSTPAQPASTAKAVKPAPAPQPVATRPVTTKPAAVKPAAAQPDAAQTKSASTPGASSTTASATRPVAASKPATAAKPLPQPAPLATSQPAAAPEFRREAAEATEATALATVQHTAPTAPPRTDTIKVTLNNLPLTIHDHWILDRTETQCLLKNTPVKMDDGQGGTSITLLLTPGSLQINTESDIDTSYTGTGITIDNQHHFALETVERRTNLSFSKQRQSLLASMQTGQQLQLTLGFWPTWPVTHTYSVNLPLQHFASAQKAWETCNQLLSRK